MGLINFIKAKFNQRVDKKFNDLTINHAEALSNWLNGGYRPRYIIPIEKRTAFDEYDKEWNYSSPQTSNSELSADVNKMTYEQKKFVINRKSQILELHKQFAHFKTVESLFCSLRSSYPLAFRYMVEKYLNIGLVDVLREKNLVSVGKDIEVTYQDLGISFSCKTYVNSYNELTYEQKNVLLSHKSEFPQEQTKINLIFQERKAEKERVFKQSEEERLRKEQERIHRKFVQEVTNNSKRNEHYKSFLKTMRENSEKFCIEHLSELDAYISQLLENKYKKLKSKYPEGIRYYDANNDFCEGDHLRGVDYWEDCMRCEGMIKKQHAIGLKYNELYKKYPNGVNGYSNSHQTIDDNLCCCFVPSKEEIVNLGEKKLAEYEELSITIERNKQWINEQSIYASNSRQVHDNIFPGWGCYFYDLVIENPTFRGTPTTDNYRVWQHFVNSYCTETDLDYTNCQSQKKELENLMGLKKCTIRYNNHIYDKIIDFICKLKETYSDIFVLFADGHAYDEKFNIYHFSYLKEQLWKYGIPHTCLLIDKLFHNLYKHIVVVELISTNIHLREQCYQIISSFKDNCPNITFVSLEKEYDRGEMEQRILSENEKARIAKEEAERKEQERLRAEKEERERQRQEQLKRERRIQEIKHLQECVSSWHMPTYSSLRCFSMYYYYPTTCEFEASEEEWNVRNLIWNFKANPNKPLSIDTIMSLHRNAANQIERNMHMCLRYFFDSDVSKLTLVCIPSSKEIITQRRYEDFSSMVCNGLGMTNGYHHIRVSVDGEAKHIGGTVKAQYEIDEDFFKEKYVLLFDDVITSGKSIEQFKFRLEHAGATVIAGFSIGKTKHDRQDSNPIRNIDSYSQKPIERINDFPF